MIRALYNSRTALISALCYFCLITILCIARKHTGKRARPVDSSVSGKAKRARLEESKLTKCEKELVRSVKSGEDSHALSSEQQLRTKEAAETESDNMEDEEVDKMNCDSKEGEPSCAEKMLVEESEPVEDMAVQQQESTPERVKEEATPKKSVVKKIHPFFCKFYDCACVCVCVCVRLDEL